MKFENTWTGNWEGAFHGLRHPMESYAKGDTKWYEDTPTWEHYCGNQAIEVNSDTLMISSSDFCISRYYSSSLLVERNGYL